VAEAADWKGVLSAEEFELGSKCAFAPEEELGDDWSWDADILILMF
jgi:hypothetical protein